MEQRTKLAAVYLGMCFIFTAFAGVSSIRAKSPKHIINRITHLLDKLKRDIEPLRNLTDTLHLEGPSQASWEEHEQCAGTFLHVFEKGTRAIWGHFPGNAKVSETSNHTLKCIEKLRHEEGCEQLKHKDPKCKQYIDGQTVLHFVEMFHEFAKHELQKICMKTLTQEPDQHEDKDIPIC